jgi:hypothetical protein
VIPTEFWLWWITDEFGDRRMTTYRMSREVALQRYPDARAVPGTVEIRPLPDSDDEKPFPAHPNAAPTSAANGAVRETFVN